MMQIAGSMDRLLFLMLAGLLSLNVHAEESSTTLEKEVTFILDGSGSMAGKIQGESKIDLAKAVFGAEIPRLDPAIRVGLVAYGHRRKGDCSDIEVLIPPGSTDRNQLLAKVDQINPVGKTPLAASVSAVAGQLKLRKGASTIVLVSDGIESCEPNPCEVITQLKASGIRFILHVVGFGVEDEGARQLACLAREGGGTYVTANNRDSLFQALNGALAEVNKAPPASPVKTTQAATGLGKIHLVFPNETVKGLSGLRIERVKDGKTIKQLETPKADSIHPLPADDYAVIALFATPNYGQPTETHLGQVSILPGETRDIRLGGVAFQIAPALEESRVEAVFVDDAGSRERVVTVNANDNGYYNFLPKSLLPGRYDIKVRFARSPIETPVAKGVVVRADEVTRVSLTSGIQIREVKDSDVTGWDLVPLESMKALAGDEEGDAVVPPAPLVSARPPSGNKTTLWMPYLVPPGHYVLKVLVNGMSEPLTVAADLEIKSGELLQFETGL